MNDVRDILDMAGEADLPTGEAVDPKKSGVGRKKGSFRPKENPPKRPEGMHRELYALLCADGGKNFQELAPILPTDTPGGYKKKVQLGAKKVRKWRFDLFAHPGRKDVPFIRHWRRVGEESKEYPFARFNCEVGIPEFTDAEYTEHLEQDGWSRADTDHLFELAKRFDLRFFVMQDRWNTNKHGHRSVEDLKDRYYNISNILTKLRKGDEAKIVIYDADHEKKRREQLKKLWSRTPEQVEEEEFLRSELKKIEARKREREKKTQDLQKLITAADAGAAQAEGGNAANLLSAMPAVGKKLTSEQKKLALVAAKKKSGKTQLSSRIREGSLSTNAPDVFMGIKWPDLKTAGVFLRSQKMKLPSSVGTKKAKAIEQILNLLGVDSSQVPTEEIANNFNELRSDIVLLYELKSALTTCEMEIHSLAHQCEATSGKKLEIPAMFLNESTSSILKALEVPTKSHVTPATPIPSAPPTPGTPGSISSALGVNDLDIVVPNRKRKAALDQANILRKLKSKM